MGAAFVRWIQLRDLGDAEKRTALCRGAVALSALREKCCFEQFTVDPPSDII